VTPESLGLGLELCTIRDGGQNCVNCKRSLGPDVWPTETRGMVGLGLNIIYLDAGPPNRYLVSIRIYSDHSVHITDGINYG
jgi:hypothetical protein